VEAAVSSAAAGRVPPELEPPPDLEIALALSGGGHRATLFGLGALLAFADTDAHERVSSIASVSGGSLANGAIAARLDYRTASAADITQEVRDISRNIASAPCLRSGWLQKVVLALLVIAFGGALFAPWWLEPHHLHVHSGWADRHLDLVRAFVVAGGTLVVGALFRTLITGGGPLFGWGGIWVYFACLVALGEAVYAGSARLEGALSILLYVVGSLALLTAIAQRGWFAARAFGHQLFPQGPRTQLSELRRDLDHVICASDLHAGEFVYFAPRFVYAWRFGRGSPGALRLHTPVQASAAFPGAFPVTWVRRARFGFQRVGDSEHQTPWALALVDGGVYDNMGDEWASEVAKCHQPPKPGKPGEGNDCPYRDAQARIVVNASAGLPYKGVKRLTLPLVGGALAFWKEKSVLYDSGTAQRRRAMVREFDLAARGGEAWWGTLVHISQSPYKGARAFAGQQALWPGRAARAQSALAFLGEQETSEEAWSTRADDNSNVPTTLLAFDAKRSARLLHHGYVLAAVNAHVFLGHPLPEPARTYADFLALVSG
jgi:predicted acylesterase/phospholipase RssA